MFPPRDTEKAYQRIASLMKEVHKDAEDKPSPTNTMEDTIGQFHAQWKSNAVRNIELEGKPADRVMNKSQHPMTHQ